MFDTVLIANRGEIAVRVMNTLRRMGIRTAAVYTEVDAGTRHVREADVAFEISSYLSIPDIVRAALDAGARAVHPGYGFLAENARFARACADAGLVFIGPPADAIEAMGDKIHAKATVSAAGVPVVPGRSDVDDLAKAAAEVGYPVLLKPSAGGGGKGMRLVSGPADLSAAVESAQREAKTAFGDDRLLIERFVTDPRHIEIQILADNHGTVLYLGERECSLQRRHQKIIEEAPSVLLDEPTRRRMGAAAAEAARSVGYTGAGTVEFIVSAKAPDEFFFMEMNTRLQVEHPVTELVTGLDLVEWQVRVAAGEPLAMTQDDIRVDGHAVEARVYAEDPARGFIPTGGRVLGLHEPAGVRVDSWLSEGVVVGSDYDPMLAKIVAWGPDRAAALHKLDRALADTAVLGLTTNVSFLRTLINASEVQSGQLDTGLVERLLDRLGPERVDDEFFVAAALDRLLRLVPETSVVDPWEIPNGWRLGGRGGVTLRLKARDTEALVRVEGLPDAATVTVEDGEPVHVSARRAGDLLEVRCAGEFRRYRRALDGDLWLAREGRCLAIGERPNLLATHGETTEGGPVVSPMPGVVLVVKVEPGETVGAGAPLVVVEAMKMEHTVVAPVDGVVSELRVRAGQQVALDETLAVVTPEEQP
ncbi:MAG TPA: biotin carboxylase N-terminal domain-containing protein [Amycolatopsis sp.]|nr:biotin carboxylase N-terminal domain-containing protein [Amycolatopsis sp.]